MKRKVNKAMNWFGYKIGTKWDMEEIFFDIAVIVSIAGIVWVVI